MAHHQRPESDELSIPVLSLPSISEEETGTSGSPYILALPAEILLKIVEEPELSQCDLVNLRLVCDDLLPYATQGFVEKCFKDGLHLDTSTSDFAHLAAIFSSQLGPALSSVHFAHVCKPRATQNKKATKPEYSAIRDIKFEAEIEPPFSPRALKKVLQQTNHLTTFLFNPTHVRQDVNCRCESTTLFYLRRHARRLAHGLGAKIEEREKVDTILSSIKSDCLSELVIKNTVIPYKTLTGLLQRHCGTMRKLSMRRCQLIGGSWIDLLQWISHNVPSLEYLDLFSLQELRWRQAFFGYKCSESLYRESVTITGKKDIVTHFASLGNGDTSGW